MAIQRLQLLRCIDTACQRESGDVPRAVAHNGDVTAEAPFSRARGTLSIDRPSPRNMTSPPQSTTTVPGKRSAFVSFRARRILNFSVQERYPRFRISHPLPNAQARGSKNSGGYTRTSDDLLKQQQRLLVHRVRPGGRFQKKIGESSLSLDMPRKYRWCFKHLRGMKRRCCFDTSEGN